MLSLQSLSGEEEGREKKEGREEDRITDFGLEGEKAILRQSGSKR